jgi:hypothetical protein
VVRVQEEILMGVDEGGHKNQPSELPGCRANVRQNLDWGEQGNHQAYGKHEESAVIDHEAVAEPSYSLSLDSSSNTVIFGTMPRPCGYKRPGSKNGQRRSGTALIIVPGHQAGPSAESRQGLQ